MAACQELRSRELRNGVDLGSRMELCRADWVLMLRGKTERARDGEMRGLEVRREEIEGEKRKGAEGNR